MKKKLEKNSSKMQLTAILLGGSIRDLPREHMLMDGAVLDSKEMANAINTIANRTIRKGYFIRKKKPTNHDWSFGTSNFWDFPI